MAETLSDIAIRVIIGNVALGIWLAWGRHVRWSALFHYREVRRHGDPASVQGGEQGRLFARTTGDNFEIGGDHGERIADRHARRFTAHEHVFSVSDRGIARKYPQEVHDRMGAGPSIGQSGRAAEAVKCPAVVRSFQGRAV